MRCLISCCRPWVPCMSCRSVGKGICNEVVGWFRRVIDAGYLEHSVSWVQSWWSMPQYGEGVGIV